MTTEHRAAWESCAAVVTCADDVAAPGTAPPTRDGFLQRIRLAFLAMALVNAGVLMVLVPLLADSPVLRGVTLGSLVLVIVGDVVAYRHDSWRTWHLVPDLLAITSLTVADGAVAIAAGVLFPGLLYRSVVDPGRARLWPGLPYLAAYVVGLVLVGAPSDLDPSTVFPLPAIVVVAVIGRLLGRTLQQRETASERERTLMAASFALSSAASLQDIFDVASARARCLAGSADGVATGVAFGLEHDLEAWAVGGDPAVAVPVGTRFDLHRSPEVRDRLRSGEVVVGGGPLVEPVSARLGEPPDVREFIAAPLIVEGRLRGFLMCATRTRLPSDAVQSLGVLGNLVSMALVNVSRVSGPACTRCCATPRTSCCWWARTERCAT
jgi:hypothetical protein